MSSSRRNPNGSGRLGLEPLEDRRMLSTAAEQGFIYTLHVARNDQTAFADTQSRSFDFETTRQNPSFAPASLAERDVSGSAATTLQSNHSSPAEKVVSQAIPEVPTERTRVNQSRMADFGDEKRRIGVSTSKDATRVKQWVIHSPRKDVADVLLTGIIINHTDGDRGHPTQGLHQVRMNLSETIARADTASRWSSPTEPESSFIIFSDFQRSLTAVVEAKSHGSSVEFDSEQNRIWVGLQVTKKMQITTTRQMEARTDTPTSSINAIAADARVEFRKHTRRWKASSRTDIETDAIILVLQPDADRELTRRSHTIRVQRHGIHEKPAGTSLTNVRIISEMVPSLGIGEIVCVNSDRSSDFNYVISASQF